MDNLISLQRHTNNLVFNNCVYDLERDIITPIQEDIYKEYSLGYDYVIPTRESCNRFENYVHGLFNTRDESERFLRHLSRFLTKENPVRALWDGQGSGRSTLSRLISKALAINYIGAGCMVRSKEIYYDYNLPIETYKNTVSFIDEDEGNYMRVLRSEIWYVRPTYSINTYTSHFGSIVAIVYKLPLEIDANIEVYKFTKSFIYTQEFVNEFIGMFNDPSAIIDVLLRYRPVSRKRTYQD